MTDLILKFKNHMNTQYWNYLIIILSNSAYRGI